MRFVPLALLVLAGCSGGAGAPEGKDSAESMLTEAAAKGSDGPAGRQAPPDAKPGGPQMPKRS